MKRKGINSRKTLSSTTAASQSKQFQTATTPSPNKKKVRRVSFSTNIENVVVYKPQKSPKTIKTTTTSTNARKSTTINNNNNKQVSNNKSLITANNNNTDNDTNNKENKLNQSLSKQATQQQPLIDNYSINNNNYTLNNTKKRSIITTEEKQEEDHFQVNFINTDLTKEEAEIMQYLEDDYQIMNDEEEDMQLTQLVPTNISILQNTTVTATNNSILHQLLQEEDDHYNNKQQENKQLNYNKQEEENVEEEEEEEVSELYFQPQSSQDNDVVNMSLMMLANQRNQQQDNEENDDENQEEEHYQHLQKDAFENFHMLQNEQLQNNNEENDELYNHTMTMELTQLVPTQISVIHDKTDDNLLLLEQSLKKNIDTSLIGNDSVKEFLSKDNNKDSGIVMNKYGNSSGNFNNNKEKNNKDSFVVNNNNDDEVGVIGGTLYQNLMKEKEKQPISNFTTNFTTNFTKPPILSNYITSNSFNNNTNYNNNNNNPFFNEPIDILNTSIKNHLDMSMTNLYIDEPHEIEEVAPLNEEEFTNHLQNLTITNLKENNLFNNNNLLKNNNLFNNNSLFKSEVVDLVTTSGIVKDDKMDDTNQMGDMSQMTLQNFFNKMSIRFLTALKGDRKSTAILNKNKYTKEEMDQLTNQEFLQKYKTTKRYNQLYDDSLDEIKKKIELLENEITNMESHYTKNIPLIVKKTTLQKTNDLNLISNIRNSLSFIRMEGNVEKLKFKKEMERIMNESLLKEVDHVEMEMKLLQKYENHFSFLIENLKKEMIVTTTVNNCVNNCHKNNCVEMMDEVKSLSQLQQPLQKLSQQVLQQQTVDNKLTHSDNNIIPYLMDDKLFKLFEQICSFKLIKLSKNRIIFEITHCKKNVKFEMRWNEKLEINYFKILENNLTSSFSIKDEIEIHLWKLFENEMFERIRKFTITKNLQKIIFGMNQYILQFIKFYEEICFVRQNHLALLESNGFTINGNVLLLRVIVSDLWLRRRECRIIKVYCCDSCQLKLVNERENEEIFNFIEFIKKL
ncbi:hypothetical protein ABK040_001971 [Willaertia magna]